ncbi:MAG: alpha/beta hydrolase [Chloroflexi bacterium]|nr:alpha/beta hydrolase [Chloroflexota bacterium]
MYMNAFATTLAPLDMTKTEEFASLIQSANDLGIPHTLPVQCYSKQTVVNGMRFHYLEWGDPKNPPLVVAHGGNQTSHSWDLVSLVLAQKFHVFAPDQRGHGDSEWPRDGEMSSSQMAEDMRELFRAWDIQRPILFGHSMGGIMSMYLLTRNPNLVERAVFVDIGPETGSGSAAIREFVNANKEFDSMEQFIQNVRNYDPFRSEEHIRRTARYNLLQRADGKFATKHAARGGGESPRTAVRPSFEEVTRIGCPALVVRGGESNVLTPEGAVKFAEALPQGRTVTVPKCAHNVHSQNTLGFLEAVLPFIGF